MAINLYEGIKDLPKYDSKHPFWQVADGDEIKSMALCSILSELEHDPSRMSDAECRSTLAKCHAYMQTAFFRSRIEITIAQAQEQQANQEPEFEDE